VLAISSSEPAIPTLMAKLEKLGCFKAHEPIDFPDQGYPGNRIVGITVIVATSAINDAPCTPLAPLEVKIAVGKIINCWLSVSGVLVACANQRSRRHIMLELSVLSEHVPSAD
jgi:hypothetical protein